MPCTADKPRSLRSRHLLPRSRRWSRPSGRKNAHRGLRRSSATASGPTRSQVPIASEKNSLCPTMPHQMPVLPQSPKPTQCINSDGTIGNDSPGTLSDPNVITASFDLEGYLLSGGGGHLGGFYDRSSGNFGLFYSFDLGGGFGGSGGFSVGVASNLSSFQGPTGVVGGGIGPVAATYTFQSGDPTSPVAVSIGPAYNMMPVINAPASFHVGKSFTKISFSTLKPCP